MTGPGAVTIMNRSVPIGTHICAFYSGPASRDELVMPFLAEGIIAGDKCICIVESLGPAEVLTRLGRLQLTTTSPPSSLARRMPPISAPRPAESMKGTPLMSITRRGLDASSARD